MTDLDRLEQLPVVFQAVARRAATCTAELVSGPLLDLAARYLSLRDERPDLAPAERYQRTFGLAPDPDTMLRGVGAWAQMIHDLLTLIADVMAGIAATVPGPDLEDRTHATLVFLVEAMTRNFAVPEDDRSTQVACGELSLEDAIQSLGPKAAPIGPKRAPPPRRPIAAIFEELIAHAKATDLPLRIPPVLAAAVRYATLTGQPEETRLTASLGADHPLRADFAEWFGFASELVGDLDDVADLAALPGLRARNLDLLIYMLERSIGDDTGAEIEDVTDAILDGRLSLAEALAKS